MFNFLKKQLTKIYSSLSKAKELFTGRSIDQNTLQELEQILIEADTGPKTARFIIEQLKKQFAGKDASGIELKEQLEKLLISMLPEFNAAQKQIFLLVGINGSGKTTFSAKLADHFHKQGKKVILVAADTFRAAATEQLQEWASRINVQLIKGTPEQDPASVVFVGCQEFVKQHADILIIDTAGRLQTKTNLMNELAKIKKIVAKQCDEKKVATLLTIDSMLGQNSIEQARIFNDATHLDGIVLTKMDGSAKGGAIFAIAHEIKIPIAFISFGEQLENMKQFNATDFVQTLLN